ncbi:MAG: DUF3284 domain-containing protein [Lachnospiraceae bacterium]|nr:DUF3284 domain-containing protein [Lachnospiraceae bacterium]
MKIIRNLSITKEEFFDYLEEQLLNIANHNLEDKEAYTKKDIQSGFSIVDKSKSDKAVTDVELRIEEYVRGTLYAATARSLTDSYHVEYHITEDTEGIQVEYLQENLALYAAEQRKGFFQKWGEALYLARMSNSLYDMQNEILKKRKQAV